MMTRVTQRVTRKEELYILGKKGGTMFVKKKGTQDFVRVAESCEASNEVCSVPQERKSTAVKKVS